MILRRLRIDRFRSLTALDVALPERGTILLRGGNAAGKSSALDAILVALYGHTSHGDAPDEPYALELDLTIAREWLAIRRTDTTLELACRESRETLKGELAQERLSVVLGVSADALLATRFVAQRDVDRLERLLPARRAEVVNELLGISLLTDLNRRFGASDEERGVESRRGRVALARFDAEAVRLQAERDAALAAAEQRASRARQRQALEKLPERIRAWQASQEALDEASENAEETTAIESGLPQRERQLSEWRTLAERLIEAERAIAIAPTNRRLLDEALRAREAQDALAARRQTLAAEAARAGTACAAVQSRAAAAEEALRERAAQRERERQLVEALRHQAGAEEDDGQADALEQRIAALETQAQPLERLAQEIARQEERVARSASRSGLRRRIEAVERERIELQERSQRARETREQIAEHEERLQGLSIEYTHAQAAADAANAAMRLSDLRDALLAWAVIAERHAAVGADQRRLQEARERLERVQADRVRLVAEAKASSRSVILTASGKTRRLESEMARLDGRIETLNDEVKLLEAQYAHWGDVECLSERFQQAVEAIRQLGHKVPDTALGAREEASRLPDPGDARQRRHQLVETAARLKAERDSAEQWLARLHDERRDAQEIERRLSALELEAAELQGEWESLPEQATEQTETELTRLRAEWEGAMTASQRLPDLRERLEGLRISALMQTRAAERLLETLGVPLDEAAGAIERLRAAWTQADDAALEEALRQARADLVAAEREVAGLQADLAAAEREVAAHDRNELDRMVQYRERACASDREKIEVYEQITAALDACELPAEGPVLMARLAVEAAALTRDRERIARRDEAARTRAEREAWCESARQEAIAAWTRAAGAEEEIPATPAAMQEALPRLQSRADAQSEIVEEEPALVDPALLEATLAANRAARNELARSLRLPEETLLDLAAEEAALAEAETERLIRSRAALILDRARDTLAGRVLPTTLQTARELVPGLTDGRCQDLHWDETTNALTVFDAAIERRVPAGRLSTGLREQVSLALRLSFTLATQTEPMGWLILDEPIAEADAERMLGFVDLLTRGALNHQFAQILLASRSEFIDPSRFDVLINLDDTPERLSDRYFLKAA